MRAFNYEVHNTSRYQFNISAAASFGFGDPDFPTGTMDGQQMYSRGSVVGKASTIGPEISPTPPLIFTGVKKCDIWRRFQHHSTLSRPRLKLQETIRTLKQTSCVEMIAQCLRQVCHVF